MKKRFAVPLAVFLLAPNPTPAQAPATLPPARATLSWGGPPADTGAPAAVRPEFPRLGSE